MTYYKVRIEVRYDWNPAESDTEELENTSVLGRPLAGREVVAVMDRPQDVDDDDAMSFFGGDEGDADQTQG